MINAWNNGFFIPVHSLLRVPLVFYTASPCNTTESAWCLVGSSVDLCMGLVACMSLNEDFLVNTDQRRIPVEQTHTEPYD